ncbi:MAG: 3-deoxy-manno-octulosonate cytidylyltransferase [Verrucomicrobia bacterium]|nr:MAG: 3-deoxy-manno-octulosonate cytidylyltransferase [Verrucomicrobiota bacterium]
MSVSVVIPARWKSERLPGKMLADLGGRPLLWHTWNRVCQMKLAREVVIAVDHQDVFNEVKKWGAQVVMTDEKCQSGTERIFSILDQLKGDMILNVQGDECFVDWKMLDKMVEAWRERDTDILTPVYQFKNWKDVEDSSNVKVVVGEKGRALYFSRSPIPHIRGIDPFQWIEKHPFWWHIGVYGYKREVLEKYGKLPRSSLEEVEKLEQLRFIEAGFEIRVMETDYHAVSVDTAEHLEEARKLILKN